MIKPADKAYFESRNGAKVKEIEKRIEEEINDNRLCFCGAELEETWRTRK